MPVGGIELRVFLLCHFGHPPRLLKNYDHLNLKNGMSRLDFLLNIVDHTSCFLALQNISKIIGKNCTCVQDNE